MNTQKDELISWLNDAYSMELTNMKILEGHIKDTEEFSDIQSHLKQHLAETQQHAERIKSCLEAIGGKVSRTKAGLGRLMGQFKGRSSSIFNDDVVKDVLSESATEHFEIACYKSLIAAAEQLGENFRQRLREFCQSRGINFFSVSSDTPLEQLLLKQLRAAEVWG